MSWGNSVPISTPPDQYTRSCNQNQDQQECINEVVEDYGVVLVASSGNHTSFDSNGPNLLYNYPASYDNVISVAGVNHWYTLENYPSSEPLYQPPNGDEFIQYIEDSVARYVDITDPSQPIGLYSQYWNPDNTYMHTLNEVVDICAPGYVISKYSILEYNCATHSVAGKYGSGTSQAAPIVTGTTGLMLTVNECLNPAEVETILKLTAKDIEVNPMNSFSAGYIGAGKLETGNLVEFVNEMQKSTGIATIKDHVFYRYEFDLEKFNNKLSIENVVFKDDAIVNFTVKNSIDLKEGTHLVPNNNGSISLKTDNTINDVCLPNNNRQSNSINTDKFEKKVTERTSHITVYPNPTLHSVVIQLEDQFDVINTIEIYTLQGNLVLHINNDSQKNSININLSNLKSGMYLIKTITKFDKIINSKVIKQ